MGKVKLAFDNKDRLPENIRQSKLFLGHLKFLDVHACLLCAVIAECYTDKLMPDKLIQQNKFPHSIPKMQILKELAINVVEVSSRTGLQQIGRHAPFY